MRGYGGSCIVETRDRGRRHRAGVMRNEGVIDRSWKGFERSARTALLGHPEGHAIVAGVRAAAETSLMIDFDPVDGTDAEGER